MQCTVLDSSESCCALCHCSIALHCTGLYQTLQTGALHCALTVQPCDTWMYYSLNCALCNFTVHFTITALDALCYCTVHCDIAVWQFSALCHCTAPATLGARLSFSGVRVSARQSSFLATICPENDQIHGSGQRKQNKQSEAKIGHMTIDLCPGRQLHKNREQTDSFLFKGKQQYRYMI